MRKILFTFSAVMFTISVIGQTTHTVTNSGFTFSPDTVTIDQGDIVNFTLGGTHNAVEVDQATWLANQPTSNGGFSTPLGGGSVTFPNSGTFYYVCTNHVASMGMKGVVIVLASNGIQENKNRFSVSAFPTKIENFCNLKIEQEKAADVSVVIYDVTGACVKQLPVKNYAAGVQYLSLDMAELRSGMYFITVFTNEQKTTVRVVK